MCKLEGKMAVRAGQFHDAQGTQLCIVYTVYYAVHTMYHKAKR